MLKAILGAAALLLALMAVLVAGFAWWYGLLWLMRMPSSTSHTPSAVSWPGALGEPQGAPLSKLICAGTP